MSTDLGNGVAIARLLGDDGTTVVGHIYLWESDDLGILWTGVGREISFVDGVLDADVLALARAADSAKLVQFLETLPVRTPKND